MNIDHATEQENILLLLRRIHFFDGLKFDELERLSSLVKLVSVEAGEVIFRQGDPPEAFYIIERGRVQILRPGSGGEEVVAVMGRSGDFFGEMALIEARPRSATVRAVAPTDLLVISRPDFEELIREHPSAHFEVTRALSHNLRRSDAQFVEKLLDKNRQLSQALADLREAQEELLRRERLSLVGRLAAGIIHDLKKPLTCISGYAQLLGTPGLDEEKKQRYAQAIVREVQRLVDMADEILRFSRGEHEIKLREVDFPAYVEGIFELMQFELEGGNVRLEKQLEYGGPATLDADKFKSVFFNIVSNAMSAMSEGGVLNFLCRQEGPWLRMDFADTGHGMSEEVKRRVFDEFFSQRKDGVGLGMAIVKRTVEAHGGTIAVESELDFGTRFIIRLPLEPH